METSQFQGAIVLNVPTWQQIATTWLSELNPSKPNSAVHEMRSFVQQLQVERYSEW